MSLAWDEYDEQDQNVVTFQFPSVMLDSAVNGNSGQEDDEEWEDQDDAVDAEAEIAVDRILAKYSKLKMVEDDEDGDFDERYEKKLKEKMDMWKRDYYRVGPFVYHPSCLNPIRLSGET